MNANLMAKKRDLRPPEFTQWICILVKVESSYSRMVNNNNIAPSRLNKMYVKFEVEMNTNAAQ